MAKSNATANQELPDSVNDVEDQLEGVMEYSEDISDAERPEPLPIGDYPATILKVERKTGKESGRPYANISLQIDASDMPADYVEKYQLDKKVLRSIQMVLEDTPQARYNMKQFCQAVGAPMSRRINLAEFTGLTCKVTVDHRDNLEGNPEENVRKFMRA